MGRCSCRQLPWCVRTATNPGTAFPASSSTRQYFWFPAVEVTSVMLKSSHVVTAILADFVHRIDHALPDEHGFKLVWFSTASAMKIVSIEAMQAFIHCP
eukprot:1750237-Rhodomonas_salina.3